MRERPPPRPPRLENRLRHRKHVGTRVVVVPNAKAVRYGAWWPAPRGEQLENRRDVCVRHQSVERSREEVDCHGEIVSRRYPVSRVMFRSQPCECPGGCVESEAIDEESTLICIASRHLTFCLRCLLLRVPALISASSYCVLPLILSLGPSFLPSSSSSSLPSFLPCSNMVREDSVADGGDGRTAQARARKQRFRLIRRVL